MDETDSMDAASSNGWGYHIRVVPAPPMAGGRYGYVAEVVDLCRERPGGKVERFESPFGQYHGESAEEAEARARAGMERWIGAQRRS